MRHIADIEAEVLKKIFQEPAFLNLIGAENWALTEEDEEILWSLMQSLTGTLEGPDWN